MKFLEDAMLGMARFCLAVREIRSGIVRLGLCTVLLMAAGTARAEAQSCAPVAGDDACFVKQTVPRAMVAGRQYTVSITMKNTAGPIGPWRKGQHRLGSQNPQDNWTWGLSRVDLAHDVFDGGEYTFQFVVTAPAATGVYAFQWRMLSEHLHWFGSYTPSLQVEVVSASGIPNPSGRVAVIAADRTYIPDAGRLGDVAQTIEATGLFRRVDQFVVDRVPETGASRWNLPWPTLEALVRDYDALFVYSNHPFVDPDRIGDILAAYIDVGRGVVFAPLGMEYTFAAEHPDTGLRGRVMSADYLPILASTYSYGTRFGLGSFDPASPLMAGVSQFDGGALSARHVGMTLPAGVQVAARWSDGVPLVASLDRGSGRTVAVNVFAPSSHADGRLWDATTDGARIFANALMWASKRRPAVLDSVGAQAFADVPNSTTLTARLRSSTLAPLVGRAVRMTFEGQTYVAMTDVNGVAQIAGLAVPAGTSQVEAVFLGEFDAAPAMGSGSFVLTQDTTAPEVEIAILAESSASGWYTQLNAAHRPDVTVSLSAQDGDGSGIASIDYELWHGDLLVERRRVASSVAQITVTREGISSLVVTATDRSGNASAPVVREIRIDGAPPSISIDGPASEGSYERGTALVASYGCGDAASGLVSCTGTVPNGAALDMAPGIHTFTVEARDVAGNVASRTVTYQVFIPTTLRASVDSEQIPFGKLARFTVVVEGADEPSRLSGRVELHVDDDRDGVFDRVVGGRSLARAGHAGTDTATILVASLRPGRQSVRISYSGDPAHAAAPVLLSVDVAEPPPSIIWAWGYNDLSQLALPDAGPVLVPRQTSVENAVAIATGRGQGLAATREGTVLYWGITHHADGTSTQTATPTTVQGLTNVIAVARGSNSYSLALDEGGRVWLWGAPYGDVPAVIITDGVAVSAGQAHAMVLKSDGTLWAFGGNSFGQLGNGTMIDSPAPVQVVGLSNVVSIAAGYLHSLAVDADGRVWAWGDGRQERIGGPDASALPIAIAFDRSIREVSAGLFHNLAVATDGTLWSWGGNIHGQLGTGDNVNRATPSQVTLPGAVSTAATGLVHSLALTEDGRVWSWGSNSVGALGDGTTTNRSSPALVKINRRVRSLMKTSTAHHSLALADARDLDAPVTLALPNAGGGNGWADRFVTVDIVASDRDSGVASLTYVLSGAQPLAETTVTGSSARLLINTEGITTLRFHAVDRAGNVESPVEHVVRIDLTAPEVTVDSPVNGAVYDLGSVLIASYRCSDALSGLRQCAGTTPNGAALFTGTPGTYVALISGTDLAGNGTSRRIEYTIKENTPPQVTVPAPIQVEATSPGGAAVTFTATALDDRDGSVPVTCNPGSGSTFAVGDTNVQCSASDAAGNSAAASFVVTVTDTTAPVLSLPPWIIAEATSPAGAPVTYEATSSDIVSGSVPVTCSHASGSTFRFGITVVRCTASDPRGNVATGSFDIAVQDTIPPELVLPGEVVAEATDAPGAYVTFVVGATDVADADVTVTCSRDSGSRFSIGTTAVECTARDDWGHRTTGSFTVTVRDTTAPTLGLPAPIVVEATGPAGAIVNYNAWATDAVGADAPTCAPATGSTFAIGTTNVTCEAKDKAGNVARGTFTTTVRDTRPPAFLSFPDNMTIEGPASIGATASWSIPGARDAVDGDVVVTCDWQPESVFPWGSTTVTCATTDSTGNRASQSFWVSVLDTTPPELTVPASVVIEATAPGGAVVPYDVSSTEVSASCAPAPGSTFSIGTTTVTCTARDLAGNAATKSFSVTVRDTTAPLITGTPADQTHEATGPDGAVATWASPTAGDIVDGARPVSCSAVSGQRFALGQNRVECRATDTAGNTATTTFTVTVVDTTPPVLASPADVTVDATGPSGAPVSFIAAALDSVDGQRPVTCSAASGGTFSIGATTVTCSASDVRGNAASGTFTVTVKSPTEMTTDLAATAVASGLAQTQNLLNRVQQYLSGSGGSLASACNSVNAFINQVEAQMGKKISDDQGAELIASASRVAATMSCR